MGSVAGLGLVGAGVAGLGVAGEDGSTRDAAGQVVQSGEVGAFRIRLGDCFASLSLGTVESATAVPCDQAHVYEVVGAFNVAYGLDEAFPGNSVLAGEAQRCVDHFEFYVGIPYEASAFVVSSFLHPTQESWEQLDDREILCFGSNASETMINGSLRNARS